MCELDFGFGAVCQKRHENDHRLWVFGMKYSAPPVSFPGLLCFCFPPAQSPKSGNLCLPEGKEERRKEGEVIGSGDFSS